MWLFLRARWGHAGVCMYRRMDGRKHRRSELKFHLVIGIYCIRKGGGGLVDTACGFFLSYGTKTCICNHVFVGRVHA